MRFFTFLMGIVESRTLRCSYYSLAKFVFSVYEMSECRTLHCDLCDTVGVCPLHCCHVHSLLQQLRFIFFFLSFFWVIFFVHASVNVGIWATWTWLTKSSVNDIKG